MEASKYSREVIRGISSEVRSGLENGAAFVFRITGRSMHPTFREGDIAQIIRFDAARIKLGDVLVFEHETALVIHRLVRKTMDPKTGLLTLFTAGDGLLYLDEPISAGTVLGKVVSVESNGTVKSLDGLRSKLTGIARVFLARYPSVRSVLRSIKHMVGRSASGESTNKAKGFDKGRCK